MPLPHTKARPLLHPDGRFDRSAIMAAAHAEARRQMARCIELGVTNACYDVQFRLALRSTWGSARTYRWCHVRDAHLATLDARTADLMAARALAPMIDSTNRMVAELAAIDAQLARLGARA